MSKLKIIALSIGVAGVIGVAAYAAYGMDETRDAVTLARGADIPARSPETVSPFGDPAHAPTTSPSGPERINGILVPPMPDKVANNATLRGIDSDNDGVRDDINRFIAEEVGDDSTMYKNVLASHRLLEQAFLSGSDEAKKSYAEHSVCDSYEVLKESDRVTREYINTQERARRYREVFAGLTVYVRDNCPVR